MMRELIDLITDGPILDAVIVAPHAEASLLLEGKMIDGRFKNGIRIDRPTHLGDGSGEVHAHVFGRHGDEVVAVNLDGSGSHGTRGRLSKEDAAALTAKGFQIRSDRVVEWVVVDFDWTLLNESFGG